MTTELSGSAGPDPRDIVAAVYGDAFATVERYAEFLRTAGITRGLLGPREADRVWDRHILNSANVSVVVPNGVSVADVGSGAGLPGLPLAILRPDLQVTLVEPLLRRTAFLSEAVEWLQLDDRVTVRRARAEEIKDQKFDVVTSRALAPLDRLVGWCTPLLSAGGEIIAVKGQSASDEVAQHRELLARKGLAARVEQPRISVEAEPATVVRINKI